MAGRDDDRRELDSAMGPSSEPGEAHPPRAADSQGLGGLGTEGKPGPPEGGTEPQLNVTLPEGDPRAQAERLRKDLERLPDVHAGGEGNAEPKIWED